MRYFDYRKQLKSIIKHTSGHPESLRTGIYAVKALAKTVIEMERQINSDNGSSIPSKIPTIKDAPFNYTDDFDTDSNLNLNQIQSSYTLGEMAQILNVKAKTLQKVLNNLSIKPDNKINDNKPSYSPEILNRLSQLKHKYHDLNPNHFKNKSTPEIKLEDFQLSHAVDTNNIDNSILSVASQVQPSGSVIASAQPEPASKSEVSTSVKANPKLTKMEQHAIDIVNNPTSANRHNHYNLTDVHATKRIIKCANSQAGDLNTFLKIKPNITSTDIYNADKRPLKIDHYQQYAQSLHNLQVATNLNTAYMLFGIGPKYNAQAKIEDNKTESPIELVASHAVDPISMTFDKTPHLDFELTEDQKQAILFINNPSKDADKSPKILFDQKIHDRIHKLANGKPITKFITDHNMNSATINHIDNTSGLLTPYKSYIKAKALKRIIENFNVSPTWILFGLGKPTDQLNAKDLEPNSQSISNRNDSEITSTSTSNSTSNRYPKVQVKPVEKSQIPYFNSSKELLNWFLSHNWHLSETECAKLLNNSLAHYQLLRDGQLEMTTSDYQAIANANNLTVSFLKSRIPVLDPNTLDKLAKVSNSDLPVVKDESHFLHKLSNVAHIEDIQLGLALHISLQTYQEILNDKQHITATMWKSLSELTNLTTLEMANKIQPNDPNKYILQKSQVDSQLTSPELVNLLNIELTKNEYIIRRRPNGAQLLTDDGQQTGFIPETIIHNWELETGDTVIADVNNTSHQVFVHKVIHRHFNFNDIQTFINAQPEIDKQNHVTVSQSYSKKQLNDYNHLIHHYDIRAEIAKKFNIKDDSKITLAWYTNQPENIMIRWVDSDNQLINIPTIKFESVKKNDKYQPKVNNNSSKSNLTSKSNSTKPKKIKGLKLNNKQAKKLKNRLHQLKKAQKEKDDIVSNLDYDLDGQVVDVVIGNRQRAQEITKMIESHNGDAKITDAFYIQTNNIAHFTKEFANVDIIVMVQNLTKHSTSYAIKRVLRPDQRFAISDSAGLQSIDRAIYRADNDLGARETQRNDIDYPIKR